MKDKEFIYKYKKYFGNKEFTRKEIKKAKKIVYMIIENKQSYYQKEIEEKIRTIFKK